MALDESVKRRLTKFENVYSELNNTVDTYNRYQPWLRFSLKNEYEGSEITALTIDTFTATATVTVPKKGTYKISHIMLINFEYDKNGSGQANTFTITFAFNPLEKQDSGGALVPPMIIDEALTVSSYYNYNDNKDEYRAIDTIGKHKCYMVYGYNFGDKDLQSPEYFGQALTAKSELRDGLIYYTVTGYSSLTYIKDVEVSFPEIGKLVTNEETQKQTVEDGMRASEIMVGALYSCFGGVAAGATATGISTAINSITQKLESTRSQEIQNLTNRLYSGKKVTIINQVDEGEEDTIHMAASDNKTLFTYLSDVSKAASLKRNVDRAEDEKRASLVYSIEELDNELRFVIYLLDPTEAALETQDDSLTTNVVYQYPDEGNNLVKSFTPDFKFETIWSKDIFSDEAFKSWGYDDDGNLTSYTDKRNIKSQKNSENQSYATFSQAVQYSYNANMTTLGIPADIPIGTIIKIRPIINGYEYHYGGSYMVLSTIDRIDTNGYTTEYELFKLAPESAKLVLPDENEATEVKKQNVIANIPTIPTDSVFIGPVQVDPSVTVNNTKIPSWRQVPAPTTTTLSGTLKITNEPITTLKSIK